MTCFGFPVAMLFSSVCSLAILKNVSPWLSLLSAIQMSMIWCRREKWAKSGCEKIKARAKRRRNSDVGCWAPTLHALLMVWSRPNVGAESTSLRYGNSFYTGFYWYYGINVCQSRLVTRQILKQDLISFVLNIFFIVHHFIGTNWSLSFVSFFPGLRWFPGSAWSDRNLHARQDPNTENLTDSDLQSSLVAESSWECCHGLVSGTVRDLKLFVVFILFLETLHDFAHWSFGHT